jgi:hypothetical protein
MSDPALIPEPRPLLPTFRVGRFAAVFFLAGARRVDLRVDLRVAALRPVDFLAADVFREDFFAADLRALVLRAADLRAGALRALVLRAADFFRVDFFAADFLRMDFLALFAPRAAFFADFLRPAFLAAIGILLDGKDHFSPLKTLATSVPFR